MSVFSPSEFLIPHEELLEEKGKYYQLYTGIQSA